MSEACKNALITGASRGIGRATALALAESGAHVLVHYGRSAAEAQSVVDAIRSKGGRADAIAADLADPNGAAVLASGTRKIFGDQEIVWTSWSRMPVSAKAPP